MTAIKTKDFFSVIEERQAFGYDSVPIGGFDPQGLVKEFNISSRYIPVLLIAIGKKVKNAHPTARFLVDDITLWNNFNN
jgi:nitroreductase